MAMSEKKNISEFEYQSDLYQAIKNLKLNVRGHWSATKEGIKSIFDLALFDNLGNLILIIETKNTSHKSLLYGKKTKQIEKYQCYQVPILICSPLVPQTVVLDICQKISSQMFLTKKDKKYKNMKIVY